MPYSVSGTDVRGLNTVTRKTPELALKKARELIKRGCYETFKKNTARTDLPINGIWGSSTYSPRVATFSMASVRPIMKTRADHASRPRQGR
jgi:hypothetical protein